MAPQQPTPPREIPLEAMGKRTRRAFLVGGIAAGAGFAGWRWLRTRGAVDGIPWPLRKAHEANGWIGRRLYSNDRLAPEFPPAMAGEPMVNGPFGAPTAPRDFDWELNVEQPGSAPRKFRSSDAAALPRVTMTTEFKCIEGWSQVVTWSGVRLVDFMTAHNLGRKPDGAYFDYAALKTENGNYYVGLDIASAMHPQTLLCDSMNGAPLTQGHGAPLRLILTVKYGIKSIKWLHHIRFQDERPADYWAERGYDWYSGL